MARRPKPITLECGHVLRFDNAAERWRIFAPNGDDTGGFLQIDGGKFKPGIEYMAYGGGEVLARYAAPTANITQAAEAALGLWRKHRCTITEKGKQ